MSQLITSAILFNVVKIKNKVFKFYSQMLSRSCCCPEALTEIDPHCSVLQILYLFLLTATDEIISKSEIEFMNLKTI